MPVQIDRVETEMDIKPTRADAEAEPRRKPARGGGGLGELSDYALRERIKPIVLDILAEEIYRLKRRGDLR